MDLLNWIYVINYTKFEHFWPKCPVYGEKSSFRVKSRVLCSYNILHAYIPSSSFAFHVYEHIYGFIQLDICDKLHQIWTFLAKMSILWGWDQFYGEKVQFFKRIIFYMRTYLLLRLQFMLINTHIWIYSTGYMW